MIIIGSIMGVYVWYSGNKNSEESEKYAHAAMKAIAVKWDTKEVLDRYNPKIRDKLDQVALQRNLNSVKKDGDLKSITNVEGVLLLIKSLEGDPDSAAVYRGDIELENKFYVMRLYISKWNNQWYIDKIDLCDKTAPSSLSNCQL